MAIEFLRGERVTLRPFERRDLEAAQAWISEEGTRRFLGAVLPKNVEQEHAWFDELVRGAEHQMVFAICLAGTDEHVGNCGLHGVDWINRAAEFGIVLGEAAARDKGFGTEAARLVLRYAFEQLNLNRVLLRVYAYNLRAIRCYEKAGYRLEGRLRQARYWEGRYWDVLLMAVLRAEYFAGRAEADDADARTERFGMCQDQR